MAVQVINPQPNQFLPLLQALCVRKIAVRHVKSFMKSNSWDVRAQFTPESFIPSWRSSIVTRLRHVKCLLWVKKLTVNFFSQIILSKNLFHKWVKYLFQLKAYFYKNYFLFNVFHWKFIWNSEKYILKKCLSKKISWQIFLALLVATSPLNFFSKKGKTILMESLF